MAARLALLPLLLALAKPTQATGAGRMALTVRAVQHLHEWLRSCLACSYSAAEQRCALHQRDALLNSNDAVPVRAVFSLTSADIYL